MGIIHNLLLAICGAISLALTFLATEDIVRSSYKTIETKLVLAGLIVFGAANFALLMGWI